MVWSDIGWLRWPVITACGGRLSLCGGSLFGCNSCLLCSVVFCRVLTDILEETVVWKTVTWVETVVWWTVSGVDSLVVTVESLCS